MIAAGSKRATPGTKREVITLVERGGQSRSI